MRRFARFALAAGLAGWAALPATAQPAAPPPAALAAATELYVLTMGELVEAAVTIMAGFGEDEVSARLAAANASGETREAVTAAIRAGLRVAIEPRLAALPLVFASQFTVAELTELLTFFRSDLGVRFMAARDDAMMAGGMLLPELVSDLGGDLIDIREAVLAANGIP